jgi:hypothetical protein
MSYRSDIAFTPSVKAAQEARGSRGGYDKAMARHDWGDRVTPALSAFIAGRAEYVEGDGEVLRAVADPGWVARQRGRLA